jgi:hypothetical protein
MTRTAESLSLRSSAAAASPDPGRRSVAFGRHPVAAAAREQVEDDPSPRLQTGDLALNVHRHRGPRTPSSSPA